MIVNNALLSALLAYTVNASPLFKRIDNLKLNEIISNSTEFGSLGFIQQDLYNGPDFSAIQLSIGSDNQTVLLKLDTKTSDFWVNSDINEFCLAYYPIPYSNSTNGTEWNSFNQKLQQDVALAAAKFQQNHASGLLQFLQPTASIPKDSIKSYVDQRQTQYQSFISSERQVITKQIDEFTKTFSGNTALQSFFTAVPSKAEDFGKGITSKAAVFATEAATLGQDFATEVTSVGGQIYTIVTEKGGQFASDVTSEGGQFASDITSFGAGFATDVTSEFGIATSDAVNAWNQFTSDFVNGFNFEKREAITGAIGVEKRAIANTTTYQNFTPSADIISIVSNYSIEQLIYNLEHDCSLYGVFNDSSSDSFSSTGDQLFVSTSDKYTFGFIGNDTVSISGVSFNASFGVADASDSNIGTLGIGRSNKNSTFQSLPFVLVENGDILKAVYSLSISSYYSSILFGAVDYAQISDNITFFPLVDSKEDIALSLSSLSLSTVDYNDQVNSTSIFEGEITAIIDTTSNNLLLPPYILASLVESLNSTFDVSYNETFGRYVLDVAGSSNATGFDNFYNIFGSSLNFTYPGDLLLTFGFNDTTYDIALDSFVVPVFDNEVIYFNKSSTSAPSNDSFYFDLPLTFAYPTSFILSILPSKNDTVVLGLDFLRDNLVVVVDLEDDQIGLAYSAYSSYNDSAIYIVENEIPSSLGDSYGLYDTYNYF
jgi:hypothetical protein